MISPLSFDSSLFGYPVGKYQADVPSWFESLFLDQAQAYHLVYIFSKNPLTFSSNQIRLVDIKLTFEKELRESPSPTPDIQPYTGAVTELLMELALESGLFSRFKTDPGFDQGEYEKLYTLWIENATKKREVLLAQDYSGFVTCGTAGDQAQIGLITVGKDCRGMGWGKRLVQAAEYFAYQQGANTMTIGTQETNIPALSLYKSMGYELKERLYVYHYWRG